MIEKKENVILKWMRDTFFPIKKEEMSKVLSLGVMFAGVVFFYTVTRQAKDILMMNIGGADVIPAAKVMVMIVAAFLGIQHSKMSRKYDHRTAFLISFLPFIVFFVGFAFLFKKANMLQADKATITALSQKIPQLRFLFVVFGNWLFSGYYIFAEMFGSFILTVGSWQLINFYSTHEQAKRIYPFFGLWAQVGNYGAGHVMVVIGEIFKKTKDLSATIFLITYTMLFSAAVILVGLFLFFSVLKKQKIEHSQSGEKKTKVKVHWKESLMELKARPALLLTAFLSVWYGLCATSLEVYWKGKVFAYYGLEGFSVFMGQYQRALAATSMLMIVGVAPLIRKAPWIISALFTPIIVMFAATAIFGMNIPGIQKFAVSYFKLSPNSLLYLLVIIGCVALVLFKAAKYTLFDPTKEMFVRSRTNDEAIKIKSLETFVGRFGKGGSSTIQTTLLSIFPTLSMDSLGPFLWIFVMIISGIWAVSVAGPLNNEMKLVEEKEKEKTSKNS